MKMPDGICVTARILDDRTYDAIASGEQRWWERIADDFWHDKFDGQNVTAIRFIKGMTDLEMIWEVTDDLLDEGIYLVTLGKRLA